jgi:hypothetical protein
LIPSLEFGLGRQNEAREVVKAGQKRFERFAEAERFYILAAVCAPKITSDGGMSLSDKESHESQSLRRLLIGYSPDEIDLTRESSPLVITHKPSLCSDCTDWFNDARQIASDHPDLIGGLESEFGYVKDQYLPRSKSANNDILKKLLGL